MYCHSVTCSFVSSVSEASYLMPKNVQTVALVCEEDKRAQFSNRLLKSGALRVMRAGRMSLYTQPWDGLMPLEQLSKRVSFDL